MTDNTRVFQGGSLDAVLDRVRDECGADATIRSADRRRTGGMGGFFAREVFEVVVDLGRGDSPGGDSSHSTAASPSTSVSSAAEPPSPPPAGSRSGGRWSRRSGAGAGSGVGAEVGGGAGASAQPQPPAERDPFLALAALMDSQDGDPPPPAPSRRAADFADELARALAATPVDEPAARDAVSRADDLRAGARSNPASSQATATPVPTATPTDAEPLARLPAGATGGRRDDLDLEGGVDLDGFGVDLADGLSRPPDVDVWRLLDLLETAVGDPPAVPARGVTVVVGEIDAARRVAGVLATSLGLDPLDTIVAAHGDRSDGPSWMRLDTAEAASGRSARWADAERPTLVVVELVPGLDGVEWARGMADACRPTQVRLALPGWRLADEQERTLAALGNVDVVDVVDVAEAADPGRFLGLSVPVATLDGRPAGPALWAAIFMSRRTAPAASPGQLPTEVTS